MRPHDHDHDHHDHHDHDDHDDHRPRGGGRRPGPPPWERGGPGWPRGGGRGRRARRGDVRNALLVTLLDGPAHGYQLIQTLAARSGGGWQPSPGAVYPSLEALLDEGLVTAADTEGRRVFTLTDAGRQAAEERRDAGAAFGDADAELDPRGQLREEVHHLMGAAKQVGAAGSREQIERAGALVAQARKDLYRLLAEG